MEIELDDEEGSNNGTVTGTQCKKSLYTTALLEYKAKADVKQARCMSNDRMPDNWYPVKCKLLGYLCRYVLFTNKIWKALTVEHYCCVLFVLLLHHRKSIWVVFALLKNILHYLS